jgi:hypothetical protein
MVLIYQYKSFILSFQFENDYMPKQEELPKFFRPLMFLLSII